MIDFCLSLVEMMMLKVLLWFVCKVGFDDVFVLCFWWCVVGEFVDEGGSKVSVIVMMMGCFFKFFDMEFVV